MDIPKPKHPGVAIDEHKNRSYVDHKTWRGIQPGTKLPHEGAQQRMMAELKAAKQWFWMVQEKVSNDSEFIIGYELKDTGVVVITSEKYKYEFTRRMSKPEVFEYICKVRVKQEADSKLVRDELVKSVSQPVTSEVIPNGS